MTRIADDGWAMLRPAALTVIVAAILGIAALVTGPQLAQGQEGELELRKIGGDSEEMYSFTVENLENEVTFEVEGDGIETVAALETGTYQLSEERPEDSDFELVGWAVPDELSGECPDEPSTETDTAAIDIEEGETTTVCAYNSEVVLLEGFVELIKVGGDPETSYPFAVDGPDDTDSIVVEGESSVGPVGLDVGEYTLTEDRDFGAPLAFLGWAPAEEDGTCPAAPTVADESLDITVEAGMTETVCAYNEEAPLADATIEIRKDGGAADMPATFIVHNGDDEEVEVEPGESAEIDVDPGTHTVFEEVSDEHVLLGWAVIDDGVCPASPTTTDAEVDVDVEAGETAIVCAYNDTSTDATLHEYTLAVRWSNIAWLGADGIDVADAVEGEGANAAGNDVSDEVLVIWWWDQDAQDWEAYFGGDTTGASDLETLTQFDAYWVAIDGPGEATWVVQTGEGTEHDFSALDAAIEADVEDRGETYAGACEDADIDEDVGEWCSQVRARSVDQAIVGLGPTFSEFAVEVVFERQNDGSWEAVSETEIEPPGA